MPVSRTVNATRSPPAGPIISDTSPASVNLHAFERRFFSTLSEPLPVGVNRLRAARRNLRAKAELLFPSDRLEDAGEVFGQSRERKIFRLHLHASGFDLREVEEMSLMSASRSFPADWIVSREPHLLGGEVPFCGCRPATSQRMSDELSGVRTLRATCSPGSRSCTGSPVQVRLRLHLKRPSGPASPRRAGVSASCVCSSSCVRLFQFRLLNFEPRLRFLERLDPAPPVPRC